ncbi:hypothetical protein HR060_06665 [Catenovulum sp. SM1970]|uniref:hypothetical protein n=1 Tax=Marinifaba aquimaris TaxID=2741323 RepID=UPI0015725B35|nr:hypothetical protein [Marinifaba aquimaris]NTS76549.1 hypothetical protein [Marinifaba aquimaris]
MSFLAKILLLVFFIPSLALAQTLPKVKATVDLDVKRDYDAFLKGRDPLTITDFSGEHSRRDVVELIILQQALHLGGYPAQVEWVLTQGYNHSIQLVATGFATVRGTPAWGNDAYRTSDEVFISQSLINIGDFIVGLYTSPANTKALSSKTERDVKSLTAIANRQWFVDWRTLKRLDFAEVKSVRPWPRMVKHVSELKGDFTLAPFQSTPDMSLIVEGKKLIPIPNFKIALDDTRHWIVTKNHPDGHAIFKALSKGLQELLDSGAYAQAYRESGFMNERVAHWQTLKVN